MLINLGVIVAYLGGVLFVCLRLLRAASDGREGVAVWTAAVIVVIGAGTLFAFLVPLLRRNRKLRRRHPESLVFTALLEGPTRAGLNQIAATRGESSFPPRGGYPWLSVLVDRGGVSIRGTTSTNLSDPDVYLPVEVITAVDVSKFRSVGVIESGVLLSYRGADGLTAQLVIRPASRIFCLLSGSGSRAAKRLRVRIEETLGLCSPSEGGTRSWD
ncbi:hypothetical protein [Subtercola endophyticus]|uniref:hypothetical protein n=1 Tax=Subtercola endophyticus TaxID=2895559 RepID=UPI001E54B61B|nr:hypothetical protein [Subtercola endophyticus]UFS58694.1 hypothetical protein LQ955_17115 [Subtercola endophyticus]